MMLGLVCTGLANAQNVIEVKGIRLYEHHSSDVTARPFGSGAIGSKSGYDFVKGTYYGSFDPTTMGSYANGEEMNLDMVEHEGMFGTGGASKYLGFTSGVSSIWNGQIKGNEQTRWHKVTTGLAAYNAVVTKENLVALYDASKAGLAVASVQLNEVYVGRIRGSGLYVLIKCTGDKQPFGAPDGSTNDNNYFNFDYKHTGSTPTGIAELTQASSIEVYPNPASDRIMVRLVSGDFSGSTLRIVDAFGKEVYSGLVVGNQVEVNTIVLKQGLYFVVLTNRAGINHQSRKIQILH